MSIANLSNLSIPSEYDIRCKNLVCDSVNAPVGYINGGTGIFNSIAINDLQQDNALDKVVVWDFNTSELKYSTAIGATGAQGPTGPASGITGPTGAQGPTGISVNTSGYLELPLGITVTLTNPMPNFINITAGGAGFNINLPQMDLPNSLQSGPIGTFFIYKNHAGSQITIVMDFIGGIVATLYPGKIYIFQVASNATPQGSFVFKELTDITSATSPLTLNPTTGELSIDLSNYVDLSSSQNLQNKTLTQPIMATVLNANNANADVSLSAVSGGDEFVTTFPPQDMLEKHFNAEFGSGSYFYSNTGANRKLKFNIASAINNTSTTLRAVQTSDINVTLPSSTGTLALVSQIPTNTSYVDLTTNQTIAGIKTFSASPVFNGPTNQTFPTYIPVGIHNTNKDLQAITNMASIDTTQTFINKTISSAANTLIINSGSLSNVNINSVVDQHLLTTSSPTFNLPTFTGTSYGWLGNSTINATSTTIAVSNVFVQIAGTWSLGSFVRNFDSPSNGVLRYQGSGTRLFRVSHSVSGTTSSTDNYSAALYNNAVQVSQTVGRDHSHTGAADSGCISREYILQLVPGDNLTMRVTNNTDTSSIVCTWYSMCVTEIL